MMNGQQEGKVQVEQQIDDQMEFKGYNNLEPSQSQDTLNDGKAPEPKKKQSIKINFKGKTGEDIDDT